MEIIVSNAIVAVARAQGKGQMLLKHAAMWPGYLTI